MLTGIIFLVPIVPFSHGWRYSMITSVSPALLALKVKSCSPGTPTIPGLDAGTLTEELNRSKYSVSNWAHQLNPVDPVLDSRDIVKFSPTLMFIGGSHGALSQMLLAEAAAMHKKAAAKNTFTNLIMANHFCLKY